MALLGPEARASARRSLWFQTCGFARIKKVALDLHRRKARWQTKIRHASTAFVAARPGMTATIAVLIAQPPAMRWNWPATAAIQAALPTYMLWCDLQKLRRLRR